MLSTDLMTERPFGEVHSERAVNSKLRVLCDSDSSIPAIRDTGGSRQMEETITISNTNGYSCHVFHAEKNMQRNLAM